MREEEEEEEKTEGGRRKRRKEEEEKEWGGGKRKRRRRKPGASCKCCVDYKLSYLKYPPAATTPRPFQLYIRVSNRHEWQHTGRGQKRCQETLGGKP